MLHWVNLPSSLCSKGDPSMKTTPHLDRHVKLSQRKKTNWSPHQGQVFSLAKEIIRELT